MTDSRSNHADPRRRSVKVEELPVLPGVVVRMLTLSAESDQFFEDVLALAREDPSFALRVLRMANSSESAPASPIETLQGAVVRLGAAHVAELVTAVAITRVFVPRSFGERDLWHHAIEVATAASLVVKAHPLDGVSPEHAYLAGLLHDIGRLILFDQSPEFVQAVDDLAWSTPEELVDAERRVCGTDHADLGGEVCAHWGVPERIVEVVRDHHRPAVEDEHPLVAVVRLADWLSIWHRLHADAPDPAGAMDTAMPETVLRSGRRSERVTAAELQAIAPEMVEASRRAAVALGLLEH